MSKKKLPPIKPIDTPDWIDTPGLKHILEKEVPLAGKLLAEKRKHILVRGQTRTGKSHIRDKIREVSGLEILGKINCASLAPSLIDSILFGIEAGAATGVKYRTGLLADNSEHSKVVILEEVGELPKPLQAKLLVYLETGEFLPVGGNWEKSGTSSIRIIATSNAEDKKFRHDFLARFWKVEVPPIHERRKDIPIFLKRFLHGDETKLTPEEWFYLMTYNWPGGVTEIEDICIQIKYFLFEHEQTHRWDFVKGFLKLKNYPRNNYFDFTSDIADLKKDLIITKLFPHFESSLWGKKNPIPTYEYDSLIREWEAWCFFFFQISKSPTNIYEDIQELKHEVPYSYSESPYAFLSDPPSIFNKYNPIYHYFLNFFKEQGLKNKEGIKILDILSHRAIIYLYENTYNEEENNAETEQQLSLENTNPNEYTEQFWEYQNKKGRKPVEISKQYGLNINTVKTRLRESKKKLSATKD